jgi:hypothetical protein
MVYDSARHKVILFGGQTTQGSLFGGTPLDGALLNDMWEWDGTTRTWTEITPASGPVPAPRSFFGMAYDPSRQKVVLFGGKVDAIYYSTSGDTWEWDPANRTWTNFPNASTIEYAGTRASQMAYDPNLGQVILFGGIMYWGGHHGATNAWTGSDWVVKSSTGPSARIGHAMATDTARSKVVLFGGYDYTGNDYAGLFDPDTWEWDGSAWNRIVTPGPGIRIGVGMSYDISRQVTVLFGGTLGGYTNAPPAFNDTWEWNGTSWFQRPMQAGPPPRDTVLAFDGITTLLFGGRENTTLNDTWIMTTANHPPVARAKNITVSADRNCQANITVEQVDDGSSDPDSGDTISSSVDSTGPFSPGPHQVTFTVTDSHNASSSATATVTVVDTTPPSVTCLSGPLTASADSGCLGTIPDVTGYVSSADNCFGPVTITQTPAAGTQVALGSHDIIVTARDAAGNTAACSTTFTVQDTTPPVVPNLPGSPKSFTWVQAATPGSTPSSRYGHGMVYDSAHSKVIMFGGQNAQGVNNNEVWELDSVSNTWTNVTPAGGSMPSPRFNFGMAYDASSGRVVIYGGQVSNIGPGIAGDTWEWDPGAHTWIMKPNGSLPTGARLGSGLAYDPNLHQVILFGGRDFSSFGNTLTGTYAWDGNAWHQLNTPVGPIGRYTHGMATDFARSKVVMFGGYNGNLLGDTWEWDGSKWTLVAANGSGPFMRSGPGLAYDSGRQRTVMFGGSTGQPAADTWEWDGANWTQLETQNNPSARSTAMVYDSGQSRLVMFSGDGFAQFADTWYSQTTSGLPTITGECSASVTTPTAMDSCGGPITGRTKDPTTYNAQGTYTVHWSYNDGNGNSSTQTQTVIVNDTTPPALNCPAPITGSAGSSCQAAIPNIVPSVTATDNCTASSAIYITQSPAAGTMVGLGPHTITVTATDGNNNSSTCSTTFTVLDTTPPVVPNLPGSPQTFNWVNVSTPGSVPSPRTGHRMVYDSKRHKIILFGGHDPAVHPSGNYVLTSHLNDIWELDPATNVWTNVTPTTGAMPVGRADFGMAYDVARDKIVIFGGEIDGWLAGDTWEWDPASRTWTEKPASTLVYGGLFGAAMAYDPNRQQVILFGGRAYYNWGQAGTYAWDGTNWIDVTPAVYPPPRFIHAMATDLARSRVVMFGGTNNEYALTDTWEWDGNVWTQVVPSGIVPSARNDPSMAYDAGRQVTVLFGGYEHNDNDTWSWNGSAWAMEHPQTNPSSRSTAIVYDSSQSRLVLFSGDLLSDTWYSQTTSGLPTVTGECSASVTAPTAIDSCAGPITGTTTDPTTYNTQGTFTVHWTYNDGNGNSSTQTQTVIVKDITKPVPTLATLPDVTGECSATISSAPTATDNCTGVITGTTADKLTYTTQGEHIVTWSYDDGHGNITTQTQKIIVRDTTPPAVTPPPNVSVTTGAGATSCGVVISDVTLGTATARDNCAAATPVRSGVPAGNNFPIGTTTVTYAARDGAGHETTATQTVTVTDNTPPSIACPANITIMDNVPGSCGASVNPGVPVTSDNCGIASVVGTRSDGQTLTAQYPVGSTTIAWVVTDTSGNKASGSQTITVINPVPLVTITGPASGSLYPINTAVNFTGTFTDNAGDSHTALWTFDGTPQAGTVNETTHALSASHTFNAAGVYLVTLSVADDCGQTGATYQVGAFDALVVVYDPDAGSVTGGGWINSPPGAYVPNPSLTGKANFGFVSRYQKGASIPDGQTEFQFKVANLNFHSTIYEWLVVAGAKAQYKGTGTVNGAGNYGFMLTAIDGEINGGGGIDKFRIKIWDKNNGNAVIYDNQMGAGIDDNPSTALAGGSIVIHK